MALRIINLVLLGLIMLNILLMAGWNIWQFSKQGYDWNWLQQIIMMYFCIKFSIISFILQFFLEPNIVDICGLIATTIMMLYMLLACVYGMKWEEPIWNQKQQIFLFAVCAGIIGAIMWREISMIG